MHYYDIMHSCKLVGLFLLIIFARLSTSKSKRSKKDEVIHVTRRQSDVTQENLSLFDVTTGIEEQPRMKSAEPGFDVTEVIPTPPDKCPSRCVACDAVNGCTKCRSRTFLYLERISRHHEVGICVHQCPEGFYGSRETTTNMCRKCEASNCASCFTHNYCTACQDGYFLYEAECVKTCPSNMAPNDETKKCDKKVDCVVSSWSSWSKCARRSASRSCKYGRKKRTRTVIQEPTDNGKQCPKLKETKRCRTPANKCPLINKLYQRQIKRYNRRKSRKDSKKGRGKKNKKNRIKSNDSGAAATELSKSSGRKGKSTAT